MAWVKSLMTASFVITFEVKMKIHVTFVLLVKFAAMGCRSWRFELIHASSAVTSEVMQAAVAIAAWEVQPLLIAPC